MNRGHVSTSDTIISKVAQVTIFFWIMKVLATTLGETAGDFISMTLGLGYYVGLAITFSILAVVLWAQITGRSYRPVLFWSAIIATTTAGTEISDFMDRSLGLGYFAGSVILVSGLILTLAVWYYRDRDLRVYPIVRRDAEVMFWLAVLFSNSLGTAFGDYLVDDAGLSFIQGAAVTAGIILVVAALHYFTRLDDVVLDCLRLYAAFRRDFRRLPDETRPCRWIESPTRIRVHGDVGSPPGGTLRIDTLGRPENVGELQLIKFGSAERTPPIYRAGYQRQQIIQF
jgi:uncharacterized membrane-anchored protein